MKKQVWVEPCTCFQLLGYDGLLEWYKLKKKFMVMISSGRVYGHIDQEFNYSEALKILEQDGKKRICEVCTTKQNE